MIDLRGRRRDRRGERGAALLELPLLVGVVIVPFAFLVLTIPIWLQGVHAADAAAAEAGRAFVLSGGDASTLDRALRRVELGRGIDPGALTLTSAAPSPAPGADIEVRVSVELPAVALFDLGTFVYTAGHTERFPRYVRTPR